jgi:GT2 family glycosyltransferase
MGMTKPLAVIPNYFNRPTHVPMLRECLRTLRQTADCDILVVDDKSELPGSENILDRICSEFGAELHIQPENGGFSRTVNVGLRRAHSEGRVAALVNSDIEFIKPGWLDVAIADPADVVGAKLLYPTMLIQHGGIYFSLLHQYFDHLFRFAPATLKESCMRWVVPVTGALQVIKPHVMDRIGYYDEEYRLSYEDVDLCLRVFFAGMTCAMNPSVIAIHHEGMTRMKAQTPKMAEWINMSHMRLAQKFADASFTAFVHPLDRTDIVSGVKG